MRRGLRPFLIHTLALTVDTKSMEKVLRKWALVLFLCCVDEVCFVPIEPRNKFLGSVTEFFHPTKISCMVCSITSRAFMSEEPFALIAVRILSPSEFEAESDVRGRDDFVEPTA